MIECIIREVIRYISNIWNIVLCCVAFSDKRILSPSLYFSCFNYCLLHFAGKQSSDINLRCFFIIRLDMVIIQNNNAKCSLRISLFYMKL